MIVGPTLPTNYTVPRNVPRNYEYFERVVVRETVRGYSSWIDRLARGKTTDQLSQFHPFSPLIIQHDQVLLCLAHSMTFLKPDETNS